MCAASFMQMRNARVEVAGSKGPCASEISCSDRNALRHVPIDLAVTSPLTRALQTAMGVFGDHPSSPTILVEALHRERVENSCDIGRSPAHLAAAFPALAFDHLDDVWWRRHDAPDARGICVEPRDVLHARADAFRRFLFGRPETRIAVVGTRRSS